MKDYNNIPFKNAAIDRLTSRTTPPPYMKKSTDHNTEWQKQTTKPFVHGAQEQLKYTSEVKPRNNWVNTKVNGEQSTRFNTLKKEPVKNPLISRIVKSKVGREYEPKVRKRHMKP